MTLWHYNLWYDLGIWSWDTLAWWTRIVWRIIQILTSSKKLRSEHIYCNYYGTRSLYTLCSLTIIVFNIIQIQLGSLELGFIDGTWIMAKCNTVTLTLEIWPWVKKKTWQYGILFRGKFWLCLNCDYEVEAKNWIKRHHTSLSHEKLFQIFFKSNIAVNSYGPHMDLRYVCTVNLTLCPQSINHVSYGDLFF